jgi:hypothetical protein
MCIAQIEQARKATGTLHSLLWSKHISLNTKKRIFYTVEESVLIYGCEIWTLYYTYRLNKKLLRTETDFWRRAARTSSILKVRNEIIREKCE